MQIIDTQRVKPILIKIFNEICGSFLKIKGKRGRPRLPFFTTHRVKPLKNGEFANDCQA